MFHRDFLDSLINNEKSRSFSNYSPENLRELLETSGNPHLALKTIHIAGTNGKGSTAHYLHGILTSLGFRTGLYTSPHLISINERIRIGDDLITDRELDRHSYDLADVMRKNPQLCPTWFDALTLVAFRHFQESPVDFAIIETGLGGRLDSTNVITPLVSVITSIGMDHTHLLGSTIGEIAREKAGIIKPGVTAITACDGEALEVLDQYARFVASPLLASGREFFMENIRRIPAGGYRYDLNFPGFSETGNSAVDIPDVEILQPLFAQVTNSALAVMASVLILPEETDFSPDALRGGLRKTSPPGRLEVLGENPLIIFDPAHNPGAMEVLTACLKEIHPQKSFTAIVAFMDDKDAHEMLRIIQNRLTKRLFHVILNDNRSAKPDPELLKGFDAMIVDSAGDLARALMKTRDDEILLFTGTFRLYETALAVASRLKEGRNRCVRK